MTDACTLLVQHGLPLVVRQALDDVQLPPTARLMMWHLCGWLDLVEYREVKGIAIGHEMRVRETTAGQMLTLLVRLGYLDESPRSGKGGRPRAFRLPYSRRRMAGSPAA